MTAAAPAPPASPRGAEAAAPSKRTSPSPFERLARGFDTAGLELLAERSLLCRLDTKFLLSVRDLAPVLDRLVGRYAVLPAGSASLARYQTLYFDTPDLRSFHDHRRGRLPRHKVRVRHYPDRSLSFLEVKTKQTSRRTQKQRLELSPGESSLGPREREFVRRHCDLPASDLWPEVWVYFLRLTLLGLDTEERVTIDLDLTASTAQGVESLDGVAILEVKQAAFSVRTPVMRALSAARIRPTSSSKYCTAIALTRPGLRINRLLPGLRAIERLRT